MGAMSKMRDSTPFVLWVLIFSFGVLWVLQDTQVFDAMAGGPTDLGSVNGEPISLEEFNNRVSYYIDQYNEQNSGPMEAGIRSEFEEQAWQDLVSERVMSQKMEDLGIVVTDEELVNMVTGENPDPFIRQQFQDEQGQIDRVALRAAIEAPENQEVWVMIEQQLRQNRQQQKLSNFITSGMRVTSREVEEAYRKENSFADIRFIRVPYSTVSEGEIQVTDQEIQSYYDDHLDSFHREESYRFQYVHFPKTPTREDTLRTVQEVEQLRERFEATENHADFLQQVQSAIPYRDGFVEIDQIREEYSPVLDLEPGEVSDLHLISGHPHLFKLVERQDDEVKFAVLSYRVVPDPIATVDRLAEEADEFAYFAREDGFPEEAENQGYELRNGSATQGTPVVPELGRARELVNRLEQMAGGEISDPIELRDAFVVVRMDQIIATGPRPLEEVRAQIENSLREIKRKELTATRLREQISGQQSLEEIAQTLGSEVQTAENIRLGSNTLASAGREPGIIGVAFGLSEGQRSDVLSGNAAAFILEVVERDLADPAEMTREEADQLRQQLEQEKYFVYSSVWLEELKESARIRDNRALFLSR